MVHLDGYVDVLKDFFDPDVSSFEFVQTQREGSSYLSVMIERGGILVHVVTPKTLSEIPPIMLSGRLLLANGQRPKTWKSTRMGNLSQ